ncbi:WapI family immunity protein [Confluentibacter sediminis]|uniref:WapI family immunity protein n=1 Tax=Confluentibacter sediminis TaxID=2219045 RepID=UPI000DADA05D|nr:hypothetical protein [Confluentibacter sediminis]
MTNTNSYFEINDNVNFIRIDIIGLNFPDAELDWDKNSLNSMISVKVGAFSGKFKADLMTSDFEIFKRELKIVYSELNRGATFEGIESQVTIHIKGDGIGHLNAKCWLMDYAGTGNELKCEFDFDQTQLPKLIDQLENITSEYPTTGELKTS